MCVHIQVGKAGETVLEAPDDSIFFAASALPTVREREREIINNGVATISRLLKMIGLFCRI